MEIDYFAFRRKNWKDRPLETLYEIYLLLPWNYYCTASACACVGCVNAWFTKEEWEEVSEYVEKQKEAVSNLWCRRLLNNVSAEVSREQYDQSRELCVRKLERDTPKILKERGLYNCIHLVLDVLYGEEDRNKLVEGLKHRVKKEDLRKWQNV